MKNDTAFVAVGTTNWEATPSFFYAFRSWDDAIAFIKIASADSKDMEIDWEIYPCPFDTPYSGFAAFCEQAESRT